MAVFWDLPALPHTDMESKRHRPERPTVTPDTTLSDTGSKERLGFMWVAKWLSI